ncbi:MAG: Card1-like endonuclease domain-containing protein, partial [Bacteroidales bacterium]
DLNSIASSVECSLLIKNFIESEPKVHDRLRRSIYEKYRGNKDLLPSEFTFGEYLFQQYAQGGFNISTVSGEMVLDLPIYDAFDLYFNARWWEILVLEKILRWSEPEDRQVWSSVETTLEASTDENVKNEVDVLVNLGTTLLFVECKSGKVSQEDIYKIAAVRNTYGGDMSKSVLVSYNPIDINIQNKCRDNNIEIFAPRYFNERVSHLDHLVNRLGRIESKIRS